MTWERKENVRLVKCKQCEVSWWLGNTKLPTRDTDDVRCECGEVLHSWKNDTLSWFRGDKKEE